MSGQLGEPIVRENFPRFKLGERVAVGINNNRGAIVVGPHPENPAHVLIRSEATGKIRGVRSSELRIMKARQ